MHIALITISDEGRKTALPIQKELNADSLSRDQVGPRWQDYDAFVFVGAMGICVRTIAPHIADKHTDPAVVCVDATGLNVVSVLSGHVGGANDLTKRIASVLGAQPVVTTQSDTTGLWPLDTLDRRFGWKMAVGGGSMNDCVIHFVNRRPTALLLEVRDDGADYLERTIPDHVTIVQTMEEVEKGDFGLLILVSPYRKSYPNGMRVVHFVPQIASVGIGLAHQAQPADTILDAILLGMEEHGLMPCVRTFATIDLKAGEPVVALMRQRGMSVQFYSADQLSEVSVPNPSDVVSKHVGTASVCEAAAILASDGGELVIPKCKGKDYTYAVAIDRRALRTGAGHIEIVGAGPGDPELISVRGRRLLERADLILYAGSLVPRELTLCAKAGAVVRSSAGMDLEEQCALMKTFYDRGKFIVRLHTGDPCIFGAIQEQMAFFDRHQMSYHITPGISSFLAAAAELRSQFTIPERCQTIILTRGEGRTPVPEREKLHLLARSQSTMCIFLSAAIVDDVQRELLEEYPADTPVAACYHLTWKDQRIYRGVLRDLAEIVRSNHLTLTTMIVVGEAIDNRHGLSELYSKHFTHLFRKGDTDKA